MLNDDDYRLSTKLGRRAHRDEHNEGLRSLLVHRLSNTLKLVVRRGLRHGGVGWFCEPCDNWVQSDRDAPDAFPARLQCPRCERTYRLETAVYEQIRIILDDGQDPP